MPRHCQAAAQTAREVGGNRIILRQDLAGCPALVRPALCPCASVLFCIYKIASDSSPESAQHPFDEYHFVVHPVMAGRGRRLLEDTELQERLRLRLVESAALGSGYLALRYLNA